MTMNQPETTAIIDSRPAQEPNSRKVLHHSESSPVDSIYETVMNDLFKNANFLEEQSRAMPSFLAKDFTTGAKLGEGEFGTVLEISSFRKALLLSRYASFQSEDGQAADKVTQQTTELNDVVARSKINLPVSVVTVAGDTINSRTETKTTLDDFVFETSSSNTDDDDDGSVHGEEDASSGVSASNFQEQDWERLEEEDYELAHLKARMLRHPTRKGKPRYAVKMIRKDIQPESKSDAVLDLACEAEFLSRIVHPNIIRLRGTVGTPGASSFMLIMDRLNETLTTKLDKWNERRKKAIHWFRRSNTSALEEVYLNQVMAAYDISRALRFLHKSHLLYRDLKPDNIGIDSRGDYKIFDFGLCKELKQADKIKGTSDCYRASGLTGSRRYMAPEVAKCLDYGFSADVFSFGMLLWQIFALETPFKDFDHGTHMERVVFGGQRPKSIRGFKSKSWHRMMEDCWNDDPSRRPRFHAICQILETELAFISKENDMAGAHLSDRSAYLMNQSNRSRREN